MLDYLRDRQRFASGKLGGVGHPFLLVSNDRKGDSLFVRQQSRSEASAARTAPLSAKPVHVCLHALLIFI
jgi:hypothetical protein